MIDALIFAAIMTAMMFIIGSEFVNNYREINEEETERKYRVRYQKELRDWKMTAQRPRCELTIDGEKMMLEQRR